MNGIMNNIFLPIFTGIASGLIVYIIQKYFTFFGSISFLGYPRIGKCWIAEFPDGSFEPENVKVKQFGSRISGIITESDTGIEYDFVGNVTRTRLITWQFKPKDKNINNYGTGLLKLSKHGNTDEGHILIVSEEDDKPKSVQMRYIKQ